MAHLYCDQTAAWIKMPLGAEVGLGLRRGLRDIVFDVDPAIPPEKGHTNHHPIFGRCLLWPYGSRPRPSPHRTRRGPSFCKGDTAAPFFGPCLLWPRSPISATAELLLWSPYGIGQTIIFSCCGLFFLLLLLLFSSPNLSRRRLDVCHTSTHGVALVRI